jgi:hypothetical protein
MTSVGADGNWRTGPASGLFTRDLWEPSEVYRTKLPLDFLQAGIFQNLSDDAQVYLQCSREFRVNPSLALGDGLELVMCPELPLSGKHRVGKAGHRNAEREDYFIAPGQRRRELGDEHHPREHDRPKQVGHADEDHRDH